MNNNFYLGLPGETWVMIAVIWAIVVVNVVLLWKKIKKTEDEEKQDSKKEGEE